MIVLVIGVEPVAIRGAQTHGHEIRFHTGETGNLSPTLRFVPSRPGAPGVQRHGLITARTRQSRWRVCMSTSAIKSFRWARIGDIPATALADDRLQLHHAAQIAVSAAISYLPAR